MKRAQSGFTLIEVLVTVFILSIGLLGLAGLQLTALGNNSSAYLRSQASVLSYDMLDRLRANRDSGLQGGYNLAMNAAAPSGSTLEDVDVAQWVTSVSNLLPQGDGSINVANDIATISVQWDDSRGQGNTTTFTLVTQL